MYLGVDGGGTKTAFLLLDASGNALARHECGSSYYSEVSMDGVRAVIVEGVGSVLRQAGLAADSIDYAYFGVPGYGEDTVEDEKLAALPACALHAGQFRCGNDMVCSWAGSLGCADGISVVAGTGSIAYGEYDGRTARAGGWGEVFGDEGSAYWIAREGLAAFSRMSDGRGPRGPLYELLMRHFDLPRAIDLAGRINNLPQRERSTIAQLSKLVCTAARGGDAAAAAVLVRAGAELAALVESIRRNLQVPADVRLPLSYTGGVFNVGELILAPFRSSLEKTGKPYELQPPLFEPVVGAALYAARCRGVRIDVRPPRNPGGAG